MTLNMFLVTQYVPVETKSNLLFIIIYFVKIKYPTIICTILYI